MDAINPEGLVDAERIGYSQAVVAGGTLYASGQVGWDEEFEMAGDDVASQAERAFENVEVLLGAVGSEHVADGRNLALDDVAKVTSYLVDPDDRLEAYLAVFTDTFDERPYPAHTILGVEQLARPEFLVEVEVEVPL